MSRGENQKLKLAYLTKIMLEKTDDEHALTLAEIIKELGARGVTAERKSRELIKKVKGFVSEHQAKQLHFIIN